MNLYRQNTSALNIWNISGSFGEFCAEVVCDGDNFCAQNESIRVESKTKKSDNGVKVRKGTVKNISDKEVILNSLSSRFTLDGGEYEVYSQSNSWQHESEGGWQPLVTGVSAASKSVRNASGAAPFMALWSDQQNRGVAFHLKAYSSWEMKISRIFYSGEVTYIVAEMGVSNDGLMLKLAPGEEVELPEIICYEFFNKTDMDCFRLHDYLNKAYPRKSLPVIYNTWLYKFDRFTYDDIIVQIEKAKELGVEYFVIDAGWFGNGDAWWFSRGDWEENLTFGFRGRMCEIADYVRKCGMKFGFWMEPECASAQSDAVKNHPEYFLKGRDSYFIDFANTDAKNYIFDKTCELIDRFGAEFVKFDFNADLNYDSYHTGFVEYFKGHCDYIKKIRARYPDIYIENCGSGGMRMTAREGELFDAFWTTDNQSPYESLRIFKDTMLRMPPQWLEGWVSLIGKEKFSYSYGNAELTDKLFATNDAKWSNIITVEPEFLFAYMKGRAISLSFDLTSLTETVFEQLKEYIKEFKKEREFWKSAVCHILTDTPSMLVLEYRDDEYKKIELVAFSGRCKQNNICVYPFVDASADYEINGEKISGTQIINNGIDIPVAGPFTAQTVHINIDQKK